MEIRQRLETLAIKDELRETHRQVVHDWYQNVPCNTDWRGEVFAKIGRGRRDRTDPSYRVFEPGISAAPEAL
jgi:hypothetical protein